MFPNDLHMLLNASGKHQGSGRKPKGASKGQPAGAVKSSVDGQNTANSPAQLSLIVYPMIYKVLCLPSGCLGFPSTVWTSHFDDFLKLDHLIQRSSPLGKNSSWWRPKQNAVRWLFSCWQWDSFGSSWIQVCHYKNDVEAENDGFQTKSSVRVHFQVHANCWEFQRNVYSWNHSIFACFALYHIHICLDIALWQHLPAIQVMNRELKVKLSQTLQRLQQTKEPQSSYD